MRILKYSFFIIVLLVLYFLVSNISLFSSKKMNIQLNIKTETKFDSIKIGFCNEFIVIPHNNSSKWKTKNILLDYLDKSTCNYPADLLIQIYFIDGKKTFMFDKEIEYTHGGVYTFGIYRDSLDYFWMP